MKRDETPGKALSISGVVALAIGIAVGAGSLSLRGMAYAQAGSDVLYGWFIDTLVVITLLVVFGYLGSRHPNAGGIAGFIQGSPGPRAAHAVEVLLIGMFSLGIPAFRHSANRGNRGNRRPLSRVRTVYRRARAAPVFVIHHRRE